MVRRRTWFRRGGMALAIAVSAGACAGPTSYVDSTGERRVLGAGYHAPVMGEEAAAPPARAVAPSAGARQGSAAQAAAIVPRRMGPVPDRASLMGAFPQTVTDGLGLPRLVRKDGRAQIWQYRTLDCVLDLFLADGRDGLRVVRIEARDRKGADLIGDPAVGGCVDAVAARAIAPTS